MTFIEYLNGYICKDIDIDLIIGDVDMPATFSLDSDVIFTEYCHEKFGSILKSQINVVSEITTNGYTYAVVELTDDISDELGEAFVIAYAGYIGEDEYNKLFKGGDDNE